LVAIVAWLDTSAEEQRKAREALALFLQRESRDELGIGLIRDVFSDLFFPGTSVIQTRARYFLFIPWIFLEGERLGYSGPALLRWAQNRERRLVEALRNAGDQRGLIGRVAGPAIKTLPSTIYWSGLSRYRILTVDVAADQLVPRTPARDAAMEEFGIRAAGNWDATIPPAPEGFPSVVEDGFRLTEDEAAWLRERMLAAAPGTLLAHLLTSGTPPQPESDAPWDDPASREAPEEMRQILTHARAFSLALNGAALLYNLLVGERYEQLGFNEVADPVDVYRELLAEWARECEAQADLLNTWDRDAFWQLVVTNNPRIGCATRTFVDEWLDAVQNGRIRRAADDPGLRELVARRERSQKRDLSRLTNERLLGVWSGASGIARLTYRWDTVRQIVTDIHEGLDSDAGA